MWLAQVSVVFADFRGEGTSSKAGVLHGCSHPAGHHSPIQILQVWLPGSC